MIDIYLVTVIVRLPIIGLMLFIGKKKVAIMLEIFYQK